MFLIISFLLCHSPCHYLPRGDRTLYDIAIYNFQMLVEPGLTGLLHGSTLLTICFAIKLNLSKEILRSISKSVLIEMKIILLHTYVLAHFPPIFTQQA